MIPGASNPLMWGGGDPLDELGKIDRSLRFRSAAGAYLSRSFTATGNRKTFVWSGWVKRALLGGLHQALMSCAAGSTIRFTFGFGFVGASGAVYDAIGLDRSSVGNGVEASMRRDVAGFCHVVIGVDTTQATASNRTVAAVNGIPVTGLPVVYSQNEDTYFNLSGQPARIGSNTDSDTAYFDGCMAHVAYVDGYPSGITQATWGAANLAAVFAQAHPRTGQWRPKSRATVKSIVDLGGANSFFLPFDDPTNTTTLCADASSKGNNWTANNISLSAGATYDSMLDTPTSNYSVLNGLANTAGNTPTNGNLSVVLAASPSGIVKGTVPMRKGRTPAEFVLTAYSANLAIGFGVQSIGETVGVLAKGVGYYSTGQKIVDGVSTAYGATFTTNDVIRAELDLDANTVTFYKNGASQGAIALPAGSDWVFAAQNGTSTGTHTITANFGQIPFTGTPTAGCIPNSTKSLPVNYSVLRCTDAFASRTDTGANIVATLAAAAPWTDWIRIYKRRDSAEGWRWQFSDDSANYMDTSSTAAKAVFTALGGTSYIGYALRVGASYGITTGRLTHVNGVADVIADGLGKSRKVVILKNEGTGNWLFYHPDLTAGYLLYMNLQQVETADTTISAVNSSGFTIAAALASGTYRWIAIAETSGLIKLGSYIDNASADGPFGFGDSPAMAFFKYKSAGTCDWMTYDATRSPNNVMAASLRLNSTAGEGTRNDLDMLSNGLKVRSAVATSDSINFTGAGGTHVYVSFAAFPFRYANAR